MKRETRRHFRVVEADTGIDFQEAIDEFLSTPGYRNVQVEHNKTRPNFCAYVTYEFTVEIPENAMDEYTLRGELYRCKDCPYFEKNTDGRVKQHVCRLKEMAASPGEYLKVREYDDACKYFYEMLEAGDIDPTNNIYARRKQNNEQGEMAGGRQDRAG